MVMRPGGVGSPPVVNLRYVSFFHKTFIVLYCIDLYSLLVGSTGSTAVDTGRTYLPLVGAYIITG